LDRYDSEGLDEEEYEAMDIEERRRAEAMMAHRDQEEMRLKGQLPAAFLHDGKL
jgi:hypothetical protein